MESDGLIYGASFESAARCDNDGGEIIIPRSRMGLDWRVSHIIQCALLSKMSHRVCPLQPRNVFPFKIEALVLPVDSASPDIGGQSAP